MYGALT